MQITRERWHHREALRLSHGAMEVVALAGGGHLASLRLADAGERGLNCLWTPAWPTADPGDPRLAALIERYGADPAGRFLAGYTGHALCLDLFGPPPPQEAALGVALHGEAAVRAWSWETTAAGCVGRVELPVAQIGFERRLSLCRDAAVLLIDERLENRGAQARAIQWVQHLTLGPPFLAAGESLLSASLDRGLSWPLGYERHELLRDNAPFDWPHAPAADGGTADLRMPFARRGTGFVTAARVDPSRQFGFIAAVHFRHRLALVYCFRRRDFPWVAIWEENCARAAAPWNGITQARGMEFGTTPMPLGRDAGRSDLFDTPGTRTLLARGTLEARYLAALATVPEGWREITAVEPLANALRLSGPPGSQPLVIPAEGILDFLQGETQA